MALRTNAVEHPVAQQLIFPAHRVVQGVDAPVAPVAIKIEGDAGRASAAKLKQAAGGFQRRFGGKDLGARHGDRRLGDVILAQIVFIPVEHLPGPLQQRVGGRQAAVKLAYLIDSQRIFAGALNAGINPRPGEFADKAYRIAKRRAGDPQIDGGGGELGKRPGKGWRRVGFPRREQVERLDGQILRQDRPAGGGALAEAGPIVDDRQPCRFARNKRQLRVFSASSARMPIQWA